MAVISNACCITKGIYPSQYLFDAQAADNVKIYSVAHLEWLYFHGQCRVRFNQPM